MNISGSIALVTGANRGLGARFVAGLLDRGAAKVYATARDSRSLDATVAAGDDRVVPLPLDVDDDASVRAAAERAADTTLLINNAGVLAFGSILTADLGSIERDMRTNYLGLIRTTRAFVPVLERSPGRAAVVNVVTLIALAPVVPMAGYSASKAAAHSATQAMRAELADRGVHVLGAYPGGIDTEMLAGVDAVKADPQVVAARTLDALQRDERVVFPDDASAQAGSVYLADPIKLESMLTIA
jgi:NAD(P)-dependent dehydrogenase (short-subunit alcohol dehydrogenase family)